MARVKSLFRGSEPIIQKCCKSCVVDYGGTYSGTFIKYAAIAYMDEGNHPYTAEKAIVELDNGRVVTVDPSQIRFKPEES
ncbi:hypothetical protein CKQ84_18715 [Shewanella sp. WE21]|jgi:hypothetical protein|uniref:hypothetical protein n=1 Tax=Shewanella sp. WE21 TaxID=2029986 RepID=UPI000CF642A4|nr:hypothetical protein [Shewanella sp. WE21]AVI67721.1 hypothetical protein CKQ84_18715 [Shewanella sp. WE21]